jgi:hypothetical protein
MEVGCAGSPAVRLGDERERKWFCGVHARAHVIFVRLSQWETELERPEAKIPARKRITIGAVTPERPLGDATWIRPTITREEQREYEDGAQRFEAAAVLTRKLLRAHGNEGEALDAKVEKAMARALGWHGGSELRMNTSSGDYPMWSSLGYERDVESVIRFVGGGLRLDDLRYPPREREHLSRLADDLWQVAGLFTDLARAEGEFSTRPGAKLDQATRNLLEWAQSAGITEAEIGAVAAARGFRSADVMLSAFKEARRPIRKR